MYLDENELRDLFDKFYLNFDNVPFDELKLGDMRRFDGFNFVVKGKPYRDLILPFKDIQSKTYEILINGKFFYAIRYSKIPVMGDITQFGILVNNMAFYIRYDPYSKEEKLKEFSYIPKWIIESWFSSSNHWIRAEERTTNIYKSNLPSTLLSPIGSIITGLEDKNEKILSKYSDFLESKFNHAFRRSYNEEEYLDDEKYFELRCLLDTRANDDWSETGYQLFVSTYNNERNVYVIPKANVFGIKKLSNPAEVIDAYAAHIFARKEGEFDFMQYAEDF